MSDVGPGSMRFDPTDTGDRDDARFRLADATRLVVEHLARSSSDSDAFDRARGLVEQAAAILADDGGRPYLGVAEASLGDHQRESFVRYSPFVGGLNPLAPPIRMRVDDDRVVGEVTYGSAYEGPPGCVHGGFIAGGFDEVLGFTQSFSGQPGMTARLTVSYRSPTPLHQPLRYVGRFERIEGRKIFVSATLSVAADDRLCAEAEGLFVSMRPDVFERLVAARGATPQP